MTSLVPKLCRFPSAVIGSLPRPARFLDLLQEYLAGNLAREEWDRVCDQAIPFAVGLVQAARQLRAEFPETPGKHPVGTS